MSLSKDDVLHVANLAHVDLSDEQVVKMQAELNDIFKMIEEIRAVDTEGVEPMLHPHDGAGFLREDAVTEKDIREAAFANAPETSDSMFLVPQYVES
ncbi:MAG: Asp-tRNA(Asn)/Glu-tRNA(Gln) amidotransferase subunit GatC [Sutterellaceae bacterium]|nr:Asp-tRNA(Asn)/Glu-tRNA(Gln) amidotransferase subunit GatC [Sutterellaceae bacterium]MDD7442567.1 Asp-tRNA(Asn)/Glu-tRNA(Gln) amidotransferase subunit GatC [Sutterellaceae bacterium]MDY2867211.1 Asp-tRNA(Asn)/Glu-tRNA(Gln) amidotransferase subunit GatC [Mesosutterella sp.]